MVLYSLLSKVKKQFYEVASDAFKNHQKQLVVFIYNAQSLPVQTISEIRYMRGFEFDSMSPVALILVGQPELLPTLRLRTFEPLFYRINSQYHFKGLSQKQTSEYIVALSRELSSMAAIMKSGLRAGRESWWYSVKLHGVDLPVCLISE